MKKASLFLAAVVITLTGCSTTVSTGEVSEFSSVSQEQFEQLAEQEGTVIIDLRTPGEIAAGKIADDALEINYYDANFTEQLEELDKDATYLIYCKSGNRSGKALSIMEEAGFSAVYDLKGGISSWK